jgi:hypothetical protein
MINLIVMRDTAGNEISNGCVYLQVVKAERVRLYRCLY